MITGAQKYNTGLRDFFIKILKSNLISIEEGAIPRSWNGWREIAYASGLQLPKKHYLNSNKKKISNHPYTLDFF